MSHSRRISTALAVLAAVVLLGACSPRAERETREPVTLRVSGSGTVVPLARILADAYGEPGVEFEFLPGWHSSGGIKGVAAGDLDIGLVSRELTPEERALGLDYTLLCTDGLVVAVHPSVGIEALTSEQIRGIYAGRYSNWAELGGPDLPIIVLDRNEDESAKIVFRRFVLGPSLEVTDSATVLAYEPDLIEALTSTPGAIGYFSLGTAVSQRTKARVLVVDGVMPSVESVRSGTYRIVRPLGFVTRRDCGDAVKRFARWAASSEAKDLMDRNGYAAVR
ncbi:MAG: phosphate ABC transporter substrate-binding protein [Coriobacteriia bacterium]|nr:phosphate ABC transporter substrate-binding protein [Coriobacteriia bacterium]